MGASLSETAFHVVLCEGWPQKGTFHQVAVSIELAAFAEEQVPSRKSRPDRAAGVACCRLNPDVLEHAVAQNLSVCDAVERDATRKTEAVETVLARECTGKPKHHLFRNFLNRGRDVHMKLRQQIFIRVAHRRAEEIRELLVGHG